MGEFIDPSRANAMCSRPFTMKTIRLNLGRGFIFSKPVYFQVPSRCVAGSALSAARLFLFQRAHDQWQAARQNIVAMACLLRVALCLQSLSPESVFSWLLTRRQTAPYPVTFARQCFLHR